MNPSVVVVGIPESGKSSFIAAFSHILEFREIETVLTLAHLSDEDRYLFEMRSEWQACQPFGRTKAGVHPIVFHLVDKQGHLTDLEFPDIAGEEFELQWSTRIWNEGYLQAIERASGILLFINAKTVRKPLSIADIDKVNRGVSAILDDEDIAEEPNAFIDVTVNPGEAIARQVSSQEIEPDGELAQPEVWDPRKADEQVKLVDVLQGVVDFNPDRRWRLGIVVSAWDLVHKINRSEMPGTWVEKSMPLLWQYLQSNATSFDFETFGVSAQGGDPASDADRLRALNSQSERVLVVDASYKGHDLTKVVAWVTSHETA